MKAQALFIQKLLARLIFFKSMPNSKIKIVGTHGEVLSQRISLAISRHYTEL